MELFYIMGIVWLFQKERFRSLPALPMNIPMPGPASGPNTLKRPMKKTGVQMKIGKDLCEMFDNTEFDKRVQDEIKAGNAKDKKEITDAIRQNMRNNKEFRAEQRG
ncbi:hypothetical protein KBC03_00095 [Patescibacteria group bacterium]|nr:hypothetical protein [Patescibacteria group bacterium]